MAVRTRLPYPNNVKIDLYRTPAQEAPFLREVLRRSRALPGVEEAALGDSSSIPLDHGQRDLNVVPVVLAGREERREQPAQVERATVTPEYFRLLGLSLVRGRLFTAADDETAPAVAVVNQAFARAYWPHENPLGKRLRRTAAGSPWITVVGVIANARTESLAEIRVPKLYLDLYRGAPGRRRPPGLLPAGAGRDAGQPDGGAAVRLTAAGGSGMLLKTSYFAAGGASGEARASARTSRPGPEPATG